MKKVLKDLQRLKHGAETVGTDVVRVLSATSGDINDPAVNVSPIFGCAGEIPTDYEIATVTDSGVCFKHAPNQLWNPVLVRLRQLAHS